MARTIALLVFALQLVLAPAAIWGQDYASAFAELRSRLDVLERENDALKAAVLNRLPVTEQAASAAYYGGIVVDPGASASDNHVRSIVEQYLAERGVEQASLETTTSQPAAAAASQGTVVGADLNMTGKWTPNGAELSTKDGAFKTKLAGRVQAYSAFLVTPNPDQITSIPNGATGVKDTYYFRRLRLGGYGTMWEQIDWATEFDIANTEFNVDPVAGGNNPATGLRSSTAFPAGGNIMSVVAPTDVWMTFRELPFGSIRIGNQKEPIGMEHVQSSRFLDFMERSPLQDAFNGPNNNGYTPGMSIYNTTEDQRATWTVGMFKNNNYQNGFTYEVGNNNYGYNTRFTWTPYYDESTDGRTMVHVGFGSALRILDNEPAAYTGGTNIRIRARPNIRNIPSTLTSNITDTGNFYASNQLLLMPEFAMNYGPLTIQAEYEHCQLAGARATKTAGPALGTLNTQGGYVEVLYFLTGENKIYNRQQGAFGRVVPFENAYFARGVGLAGLGAWQLAFRYDWLDLNDGLLNGGNQHDLTFGLNWFLNPNTKFIFNYNACFIDNAPAVASVNNSLNGSRFVGKGTLNSLGMGLVWDF
jgi:phosphate-selective porin OprO/OprP